MIAAAALLAIQPVPATSAPGATDHLLPPLMYQGDTLATVLYTRDVEDPRLCGPNDDPLLRTIACTVRGTRLIIMPNPCKYAPFEYYARIACHELGHVNGWRH